MAGDRFERGVSGRRCGLTIRQAFRPIAALTQTAVAIADGDLTRLAPVSSEDEVGVLARAFNSMTEQLRRLIGQLEQRVADRTHELTEERNFVSTVLDTANALVVVLDRQGRIVRFNRACEMTTGYRFDEVSNKFVWDLLLAPEEIESVKAVFVALASSQTPAQHENYWVGKDGARRLIAWSNAPLLDRAGQVEYVVATGIDITDQQQATHALRESESRYRDIAFNLQYRNMELATSMAWPRRWPARWSCRTCWTKPFRARCTRWV